MFGEYSILNDLKFRSSFGATINNRRAGSYSPTTLTEGRNVGGWGTVEEAPNLPAAAPGGRPRRMVGAWCFVDHYGPDEIAREPGMQVPPHPHTGLQTVSWLFTGEIEHRDSLGNVARIRAGDAHRMTAGTGITHSEMNASESDGVHLLQIWIQPAAGDAGRVAGPDHDLHQQPGRTRRIRRHDLRLGATEPRRQGEHGGAGQARCGRPGCRDRPGPPARSAVPRTRTAVCISESHASSPGCARVVANHESNVVLFGLTCSST